MRRFRTSFSAWPDEGVDNGRDFSDITSTAKGLARTVKYDSGSYNSDQWPDYLISVRLLFIYNPAPHYRRDYKNPTVSSIDPPKVCGLQCRNNAIHKQHDSSEHAKCKLFLFTNPEPHKIAPTYLRHRCYEEQNYRQWCKCYCFDQIPFFSPFLGM